MAFNPSSTIYMCHTKHDNTNKNQFYFADRTTQLNYFMGTVKHTFSNYLTVRKTLPDGSEYSSVKVDANIDTLYDSNYMFYQNANHGTRWFYAFIVNLVYINEHTTEVVFQSDAWQTWFTDITRLPSYVLREHSDTDEVGDNVVPEKFSFDDYIYSVAYNDTSLDQWGYLVATTEQLGADGSRGKMMSGIYQGLYFYYYENENNMNEFLNQIEEEGGDCVQFISVIPKFSLQQNTIGSNPVGSGEGWLYYSADPASATITIAKTYSDINGFTPRNKKLYTSPFYELHVTNHSGDSMNYPIEDFTTMQFIMYGDVSANPSITLIPKNFRGIETNYDEGISISGFPQCAFNTDTFKLWLAKNQYGIALDTATDVAKIAGGVATENPMGVVSGALGIANTMNSIYQASKAPNKYHSGSAKNNLLTAIGLNKFDFYYKAIKKEYAQMVDNFFTMFGYQTNKVKYPNISARPYYNYVQTIDVNIQGDIPQTDMRAIKDMFNNGVTFWKDSANFCNYSVNNSPQ